MTIELTYLVYSVGLTFVLLMIPATTKVLQNGLVIMVGPRDDLPEPSVFAHRAQRAAGNMVENMALFVPLVMAAHMTGVSNESTILGAQLFLTGRLLHAIVYLAGWPWVRTVAWFIAILGMAMIILQLI